MQEIIINNEVNSQMIIGLWYFCNYWKFYFINCSYKSSSRTTMPCVKNRHKHQHMYQYQDQHKYHHKEKEKEKEKKNQWACMFLVIYILCWYKKCFVLMCLVFFLVLTMLFVDRWLSCCRRSWIRIWCSRCNGTNWKWIRRRWSRRRRLLECWMFFWWYYWYALLF